MVEAIAGSGIYVRDNVTKKTLKKPLLKDNIGKPPEHEVKKAVDNLIHLGCTLQESKNY